jgi:hypothetical protein
MGLDMSVYATEGEILTDDNWDIPKKEYYWRKANQIHNWFVKNVQEGEDDCGLYEVSVSQLQSLKKTVATVIRDHKKAAKLLPTSSGFFFGGIDYDEWYWEDVNSTLNYVNEMLQQHKDNPNTKFFYASSW